MYMIVILGYSDPNSRDHFPTRLSFPDSQFPGFFFFRALLVLNMYYLVHYFSNSVFIQKC